MTPRKFFTTSCTTFGAFGLFARPVATARDTWSATLLRSPLARRRSNSSS
jgi:hypothetical protein